jgi:hypothetical protein
MSHVDMCSNGLAWFALYPVDGCRRLLVVKDEGRRRNMLDLIGKFMQYFPPENKTSLFDSGVSAKNPSPMKAPKSVVGPKLFSENKIAP